ncbi:2-C-methyl-D-erythritol 2,4-cyclodiphosphate synthase [Anaerosphaera multitolerans]|uniref:2-C-methyl-D-erythritol 2,4-cyclodiphosphate synthase n=1 Tax=Anaerosphaera multitolerans TaxID=2487351 RepID=A0A437S7V5_9FIRM|nr:2-C-methyl-D-erythritol 2,4-cyclodiphosphate synthase [Anaerosphaera multitolerans]RVU54927.1 2-C-methyl-D-erythritol 2,4-cyclodiphosphate synthase [Anaerosphaera multitolerans]
MRIGIGYDVHKLVEGRKLIVGGVEIKHEKGLLGHSDADVLIHAIMDSILGALNLGDIGKLFPDTDEAYKDIDSKILLGKIYEIMVDEGYEIGNLDSVIAAERPKFKGYIESMKNIISDILVTDVENISIKATTTEKLGFVGREEGISAEAVVILKKRG